MNFRRADDADGRGDPDRGADEHASTTLRGVRAEAADRAARQREAEELAELVQRTSAGEQAAFAELYDRTSSRVYGLVVRVLRSPDHAAEVTQEVFVEAWRQSSRYQRDKGSVVTWLATMAHRRAVDRVRSVSSETARDERYALRLGSRDVDEVWEQVAQRLDSDEVREGLTRLSPVQREALTLAYYGGFTQAQVAQKLEVPLGTVKTRIRDGLLALKTVLGVGQ